MTSLRGKDTAVTDPRNDDSTNRPLHRTSAQAAGVAVFVKAQHQCMTTRGVNKPGVAMVTRRMTGDFDRGPIMERRLMDLINT